MGGHANYTEHVSTVTVLECIDHTSLDKATDTEDKIKHLVREAGEGGFCCAAVCVYPEFVKVAKDEIRELKLPVKVATVVNFPSGQDSLEKCEAETIQAIENGADEIDLVIDYASILANREKGLSQAGDLVKHIKSVMYKKNCFCLKVILETGELKDADLIRATSLTVISSGADFIKTSTGKVPVNATPEAVDAMIKGIFDFYASDTGPFRIIGLKVAGGVANLEQASMYLYKIKAGFASCPSLLRGGVSYSQSLPSYFRIGTSSLLPKLRKLLSGTDGGSEPQNTSSY